MKMAAVAEAAASQAGIDDIVGGMRGMMKESQADESDSHILARAQLVDRCVG